MLLKDYLDITTHGRRILIVSDLKLLISEYEVNILARRSRLSGVARATCPD